MGQPTQDDRSSEAPPAQADFLDLAGVRFSDRFFEAHVGRPLLNEPIHALVELIANSWDAGATTVEIAWPEEEAGTLVVRDNGTGMTHAEFERRWLTLNYDREAEQGTRVVFPPDSAEATHRVAFGRNGLGRWAAFCFGDRFTVTSAVGGLTNSYAVRRGGSEQPFEIDRTVADMPVERHGTEVSVNSPRFNMAKLVLDEIARRLRLVETLEIRTSSLETLEVQDLQPLFESALWIFGPEFETIEYTSNIGMRRVIKQFFRVEDSEASRNRTDFVVLPDSTVSLMSVPSYDDHGEESGVERLVVIELKRPGIRLGAEEKNQCWEYVKELYARGHLIRGTAEVRCFVLGSEIDEMESSPREDYSGEVQIRPMLFSTAVSRAKSRMLRLHEKVREAPYLQQGGPSSRHS